MSGMQGVRLNCMGDTDVSDRPLYEAAPASENFFEQTSPLNIPVSRVIGIPLLAHGYREMLPWKGRKLAGDKLLTYATNPHFSVLNPRQWRYITGSVLIAREDRSPPCCTHRCSDGVLLIVGRDPRHQLLRERLVQPTRRAVRGMQSEAAEQSEQRGI
jgi:hypothetical protein